ncbi:methylated-DNA--[protein]-cysteine S-methyltransferase [Nakamurella sp. PAMC28650]|uniref:methylated-DNA--[protein]-cysteine S-methyltransferase n=1 Tax=Nakamurella sp. PAMC28650 TaxID=2762325 RepID=UPI00164D7AE3|nr:methylated-DNA--[protein]-cysteine S-methyltransferase [Nakamurella sp. PAMC28650]QNK82246.1 methylated-DNA--[protein]-cysteine S-methyltransferase [Nakamurella sp. PAMC28650]
MTSSGATGNPNGDFALDGVDTPVGRVTVAVSSTGLCGVGWGDRAPVSGRLPTVVDHRRTAPAVAQLDAYFRGELRQFDLPLDLGGVTGSTLIVLQMPLDTVPYGSSVTYGELAHRSNTGVPARGIGSIMGANPIPIVVPCHRVLAQNGLGGYSGGHPGEGLRTKRWLLTLEGVLQPTLDWPRPL